MKVIFHDDFYQVYTFDPAAERGRMEAIMDVIESEVEFMDARAASEEEIAAVHVEDHIRGVRQDGLYSIAALAAGGAIQAAETGLTQPCFGLIRPPGHHASEGTAWGFCFFNNMAIALESLKRQGKIETAYVLDIDMHYGDGTVNIFSGRNDIYIYNGATRDRKVYMDEITSEMENCRADIIGISAGFDYHINDWGGVLNTNDYFDIGLKVRKAAIRNKAGCFAILEGGYNHKVLGENVLSLIQGMGR